MFSVKQSRESEIVVDMVDDFLFLVVMCIGIISLFSAIANCGGANQNDIHLHQFSFLPLRAKHCARRQGE